VTGGMTPIASFNSVSILTGSLLLFLGHLEVTLFDGVRGRRMDVLLDSQIAPGKRFWSEFCQWDLSTIHAKVPSLVSCSWHLTFIAQNLHGQCISGSE
jgi:hypothetical protein